MSSVLLQARNLIKPVEAAQHVVEPAATTTEQVASVLKSDVGELGFLFGHALGQQAAPTPLASPPESFVTSEQSAAMAAGMRVAANSAAAPDNPSNPAFTNETTVAVNAPPSAASVSGVQWTFADTLRGELGKYRQRVRNYRERFSANQVA